MRPLSDKEIVDAFRPAERKSLLMPPPPNWEQLDFLGWTHRSGHLGFIVRETENGLVGMTLQRNVIRTAGFRRFMCDICCTVHDQGGVASFTKWDRDKCRARTRMVCADLACSLYARNLRKNSADQMPETLDRQQKIDRVNRNIGQLLQYWSFRT
ncbi:MAG TPA: FBP domain-containing protein [Stellaceae bacterium]|jgi:hypothetical protein|nr:FBP domain-containing protein [Stellaceae bacterium]